MRRLVVFTGTLALLGAAYWLVVRPWFLRWGATDAELSASLPGDEFLPSAERQVTRAITIHASPERVWPWVVQMGAGRAGFYSYDWLETHVFRCPITNADRVVPAWQGTAVGDTVRLCPEGTGPPLVYTVSRLDVNRAFVMGVKGPEGLANTWAFVLAPRGDGSTRLLVRMRTRHAESWQTWIEPGEFVMERGMLKGLQARAER